MRILITGAAGNLGNLLARHLLAHTDLALTLLIHRKPLPAELASNPRVKVARADLAHPETLAPALEQVDVVIHFAGVLFRANPERFLPRTNTAYFCNLVDAAITRHVRRIVLVSFPHVEGETTPANPACGSLDGHPGSVHARTRLQEEKYLFAMESRHGFEAVALRVGMIYGRGILMIDAARWLAAHGLLGMWRKPTWIHLISTVDFLAATTAALVRDGIRGIYHLGDEGVQTLGQFLDDACAHWVYHRPWRMPLSLIQSAALLCEIASSIFNIPSPLTRDFIRIGQTSYYGDTSRMRKELLPILRYRTYQEGIDTLI
jgi:nucleoside-diphosphate-sugar epimerase